MTEKETVKQIWNGTVLEYNNQELIVQLVDITNPDEIATLSIDNIDDSERSLVQPGATFIWGIVYAPIK